MVGVTGRALLVEVCRVTCGRKVRDALLQALLVPASPVIDKTNLPQAKARSHHEIIRHLCENLLKKGW